MQTSQIKTIISATGLMLLGTLGMHAQSIITPPPSPNTHHPTPITQHSTPTPTVMPANEMYVKGHEYHLEGDYESALKCLRPGIRRPDGRGAPGGGAARGPDEGLAGRGAGLGAGQDVVQKGCRPRI